MRPAVYFANCLHKSGQTSGIQDTEDADTAPKSAPTATLLSMSFSCAFIDKHRHPNSHRFGFHHRQSKNAASTGYRHDSAIDDILNGKYLDLTVIA